MKRDTLGIYVHIPYCRSKCHYCGFLSQPISNPEEMNPYVDLLCREIELYGEGRFMPNPAIATRMVDTIYIGGGTPSLLSGDRMAAILDTIYKVFYVDEDAEISMEGNPDSYTLENLKAYKEAGINRISMGLQAAQPSILNALGRIHDREDFMAAYDAAVKAGFSNINVDVMFGLPNQSREQWQETLNLLLSLEQKPAHISAYSLQIEEDTPFYDLYKSEAFDLPEEAVDRAMYRDAMEMLTAAGYEHYEISNFALPGKESRHNLKYWNMEDFIGVGLGASSFVHPFRYQDTSDMYLWHQVIGKGRLPILQPGSHAPLMMRDADIRPESTKDRVSTYVFTGLRKIQGIRFADFQSYFGQPFDVYYLHLKGVIDDYVKRGLMIRDPEGLRLTREGIDVSNDILADFILDEDSTQNLTEDLEESPAMVQIPKPPQVEG